MQICTLLQTDNPASTPPPTVFYRPDAVPATQPTVSKHWRCYIQWLVNYWQQYYQIFNATLWCLIFAVPHESCLSHMNSSWATLLIFMESEHTHTQPFNGLLSWTTRVGRYQKKHSPTHPSWSLDILYHLPPFTTIHGNLFVQFTSLIVLSDNLSPGPLWSSSWPWTLSFILHAFLHPIIIIFSQHMPIPTQPVLLLYQCYVIYT